MWLALFCLMSASVRADDVWICPNRLANEQTEDCPWGPIARTIAREQDAGKILTPERFKTLAPEIAAELQIDSKHLAFKTLWGTSVNFDELAKATIVLPSIIDTLSGMIGVPPSVNGKFAHAGTEHTYGYLFSVLKTSFGYKRARWVRGEIEKGFGLPGGLLGATPENGTLFSNVTWFAGNIAFRGDPGRLEELRSHPQWTAHELARFDFAALKDIRIEEAIEVPDSTGYRRHVVLRTDLVPFPNHLPAPGDTHLLVYSIDDGKMQGPRLVTAFPVADSFVDSLIRSDGLGEQKTITVRYNGYVEGAYGKSFSGTRKLEYHGKFDH